jgi:hypothetical protein
MEIYPLLYSIGSIGLMMPGCQWTSGYAAVAREVCVFNNKQQTAARLG